MHHSTKSDIIRCNEKEAEAVSHGATETDTQQQHVCVVKDDGQLIHQLDARGTGTFEQFTQIILEASSGGSAKSLTA